MSRVGLKIEIISNIYERWIKPGFLMASQPFLLPLESTGV